MINCINLHNINITKMEKKEMKAVKIWRLGIQGGKACGYGWAWSPEFESIDKIWATYRAWFESHPMTRIQFRVETKYVPA